jgi:hypothetical protein
MNIAPIAAAAFIALVATIWLRRRPSWWFLRERPLDQGVWQRIYVAEQMPIVLSALQAISNAFLLRRDDIYRLRPNDKLLAIYRAAYPSNKTPDALEFESLSKTLTKQFRVPESVMAQYNDPTIRNVVQWCLQYGGA